MTRHLWLALPLALLACSGTGGSGEDPGGTGGSLCIGTKDAALAVLGGTTASPGYGLWRFDDQARPKLGTGQLQASVAVVARDHLELSTQAGRMRMGWAGNVPDGVVQGSSAKVYQRGGWDYVETGGTTMALYWAATSDPPPSVVVVADKETPSFGKIELEEACTADTSCGEITIAALVIDGTLVFPGESAEVSGWSVSNRGVVTGPDTCGAEAAMLVTAVRKAPAE